MKNVISRSRPRRLSVIHTQMFHGWFDKRHDPHGASNYITANAGVQVAYPLGRLVVSKMVLEALRQVSRLDARHIDALVAFDCPLAYHEVVAVEAEQAFEQSVDSASDVDQFLFSYLQARYPRAPAPNLFECLPASGRSRVVSRNISTTVGLEWALMNKEIVFDPSRVEAFGVVEAWGLVFSRDCFRVVAPHVYNPYFYVEEFEI